MQDEKVIVCPNEEKIKILNLLNNDKELHNIKFMTKKENLDNYFFSYTDETLYYLMKKYDYNLDVCKVFLKNLYVIDCSKKYKSSKLSFLQKLKTELIDNNLLIFNESFKKYISQKQIEVKNYYDLDLYEEIALNTKVDVPVVSFMSDVYEFNTMEEEVSFICIRIIELLNKGIDINKIYLCNVSNDYFYTLYKIFSYYHIPINVDFKDSIYATKVVADYLDTGEIDLEDKNKNGINRKLINILASLINLESDSIYRKILIDKLKNTYLNPLKRTNAVSIKNLFTEEFHNDEYVFVLGFNQDILPKMRKDIDYITDSIKDEVDMYDTCYLNQREKKIITYLLSKIKNLVLTYKNSSFFASFYKSSLINDLGLNIITDSFDSYLYSDFYNKIRLGEKLDNYYLYGEVSDFLKVLNSNYDISYKSYNNCYTGINNSIYLKNISYPLQLSYTSLNAFNECQFKYYIKYILKLDDYVATFSAFIGSMYHKILSLYQKNDFDLDKEFDNYLKNRDLVPKEKVLLIKIKKDLTDLIDVLKQQQLLTGYDLCLYEQKVSVDVLADVEVSFVGYIDKIMYYKNVEDTYFSIVDYKTGLIDTHIEPMKYGLHMQLPIYLYLIHYSKLFSNPIFTGIYYQNILFNYPLWSDKLDKDIQDRYLLNGYSTDNTDVLARFDSTYEDSKYIKSLKYNDDKGFYAYSKIIDDDTLYDLVEYTKDYIEKKVKLILSNDFSINPKVYSGKNESCEYCSFKDLCYMKDKDLVCYDKVNDLDFLDRIEK